jgi:hypothetical protein
MPQGELMHGGSEGLAFRPLSVMETTTTTTRALDSKLQQTIKQERFEDDDPKVPTSPLMTLTNSTTGVISSPIGDFLVVSFTDAHQSRSKRLVCKSMEHGVIVA